MQAAQSASRQASETPSADGGAPARAGCVLLLPPHASSPPADLRDALAKRGLAPRGAPSPHQAMAGLMRAAIGARTLDGAQAGRGEALIIVEPESHPPKAVEELLASVDKFLPRAAVWAYAAESTPRLRRMERPKPEVVVKREAVHASADAIRNGIAGAEPSLRLHRDDEGPQLSPGESDGPDEPAIDEADPGEASLLSSEELSMLLAEDEPEQEGRRR